MMLGNYIGFWSYCIALVSCMFVDLFNCEICMQNTSRIVDVGLRRLSQGLGQKQRWIVFNEYRICFMMCTWNLSFLSFCERRFQKACVPPWLCFACLLCCFLDCFILLLGQTHNFSAGVKDVDCLWTGSSWAVSMCLDENVQSMVERVRLQHRYPVLGFSLVFEKALAECLMDWNG